MWPLDAIRRVDEALVRLLRSLDPEGWTRRASTAWDVREVAAHLLDGSLRRLSLDRDGFVPPLEPPPPGDFGALVAYLDGLNADWIRAARRLSPRVIVELLEVANPRVLEHFRSLDPESEAAFPVAWAGQERSPAWLDVAREYTEKWHHQAQIRAAVGAPELAEPDLVEPLLRALVWGLPPAYRELEAARGTLVLLRARGDPRWAWTLRRERDGWSLHEVEAEGEGTGVIDAAAEVQVDASDLWKSLLGTDAEGARERASRRGPPELSEPLFRAVGLMVPRTDARDARPDPDRRA